jgi:hypothetical protein
MHYGGVCYYQEFLRVLQWREINTPEKSVWFCTCLAKTCIAQPEPDGGEGRISSTAATSFAENPHFWPLLTAHGSIHARFRTLQCGFQLGRLVFLASALLSMAASFGSSAAAAEPGRLVMIRVKGSDRMLSLCCAWAEAYHKVKPNVFVSLNGDGPDSPKFGALANGHCDLCVSTRAITKGEADRVRAGT